MSSKGRRRYEAVESVNKRLRTQGAWRKKGNRITQQEACQQAGISPHQYRKWRDIIRDNQDKSLNDIYSALEDKHYAPNKLSWEQEELVRKYAHENPSKSHREIASDVKGFLGRRIHHSTVSRILKQFGP